MTNLAADYTASAAAWKAGPDPAYRRYAAAMVARSPVALGGRTVLDVGAGTGACTDALLAVGARPIRSDLSLGMLGLGPPGAAAVADAAALPFAAGSVGGAASAFCLNHLADPAAALVEMARVTAPGGPVLAATFPSGADDHPAKTAVEDAARRFGWAAPDWYGDLKDTFTTNVGSTGKLAAIARQAGLCAVRVVEQSVDSGLHSAAALIGWRLGMAHLAPFVAALSDKDRRALRTEAEATIGGDPQPLRPAVLILSSVSPK